MPVLFLDESVAGEFLCVGGVYLDLRDLPELEIKWARFKERKIGLAPTDVFKWSPPEEVSNKLAAVGLNRARELAAQFIAGLPCLTLLGVALRERRGEYVTLGEDWSLGVARWKDIYSGVDGVRHFFLRGLEFCLQRFARDAKRATAGEPALVIVDDLNWARKPKRWKELARELKRLPAAEAWVITEWIEHGVAGAERAYKRWWTEGFESHPYDSGALRDLGFASMFFQCNGAACAALQIADIAAGCTAGFFSALSKGQSSGVARQCLRTILRRFRSRDGIGYGVWGNGLVLWPPSPGLWERANEALK